MYLCEMYLKIIRYTFMNVSVATIEAPKGKNIKGMMDYVEDGVHISSFFFNALFLNIYFCIATYHSKALRCTSARHSYKR